KTSSDVGGASGEGRPAPGPATRASSASPREWTTLDLDHRSEPDRAVLARRIARSPPGRPGLGSCRRRRKVARRARHLADTSNRNVTAPWLPLNPFVK